MQCAVKGYNTGYSFMGWTGKKYERFVSDTEYYEYMRDINNDISNNEFKKEIEQ